MMMMMMRRNYCFNNQSFRKHLTAKYSNDTQNRLKITAVINSKIFESRRQKSGARD
jgi:hypothetical protein